MARKGGRWLGSSAPASVRAHWEKHEPLSWVALRAGFVDQSHMGRWVRRYLGTTPGALRGGRARRPRAPF